MSSEGNRDGSSPEGAQSERALSGAAAGATDAEGVSAPTASATGAEGSGIELSPRLGWQSLDLEDLPPDSSSCSSSQSDEEGVVPVTPFGAGASRSGAVHPADAPASEGKRSAEAVPAAALRAPYEPPTLTAAASVRTMSDVQRTESALVASAERLLEAARRAHQPTRHTFQGRPDSSWAGRCRRAQRRLKALVIDGKAFGAAEGLVRAFFIFMLYFSTFSVMSETVTFESPSTRVLERPKQVGVQVVEVLMVLLHTAEFLCRLWTAPLDKSFSTLERIRREAQRQGRGLWDEVDACGGCCCVHCGGHGRRTYLHPHGAEEGSTGDREALTAGTGHASLSNSAKGGVRPTAAPACSLNCSQLHSASVDSACAARVAFLLWPATLLDALCLAPFLLFLLGVVDIFGSSVAANFLRILRALRMFKFTRYSPAVTILGKVIWLKLDTLTVAVIISATSVMLVAVAVFVAERSANAERFPNMVVSLWWAIVTLTTVGYGDITPITPLGRVFGSLAALLGIIFFTLPPAVISTGFLEYRENLKEQQYRKLERLMFLKRRTMLRHSFIQLLRSSRLPEEVQDGVLERLDVLDGRYTLVRTLPLFLRCRTGPGAGEGDGPTPRSSMSFRSTVSTVLLAQRSVKQLKGVRSSGVWAGPAPPSAAAAESTLVPPWAEEDADGEEAASEKGRDVTLVSTTSIVRNDVLSAWEEAVQGGGPLAHALLAPPCPWADAFRARQAEATRAATALLQGAAGQDSASSWEGEEEGADAVQVVQVGRGGSPTPPRTASRGTSPTPRPPSRPTSAGQRLLASMPSGVAAAMHSLGMLPEPGEDDASDQDVSSFLPGRELLCAALWTRGLRLLGQARLEAVLRAGLLPCPHIQPPPGGVFVTGLDTPPRPRLAPACDGYIRALPPVAQEWGGGGEALGSGGGEGGASAWGDVPGLMPLHQGASAGHPAGEGAGGGGGPPLRTPRPGRLSFAPGSASFRGLPGGGGAQGGSLRSSVGGQGHLVFREGVFGVDQVGPLQRRLAPFTPRISLRQALAEWGGDRFSPFGSALGLDDKGGVTLDTAAVGGGGPGLPGSGSGSGGAEVVQTPGMALEAPPPSPGRAPNGAGRFFHAPAATASWMAQVVGSVWGVGGGGGGPGGTVPGSSAEPTASPPRDVVQAASDLLSAAGGDVDVALAAVLAVRTAARQSAGPGT